MKKILTTILVFVTFGSLISQVPNYVPNNGLVAWWPFTGNAKDSNLNGNDGIVYGSTLTTDRFGKSNCAYNFDGVNDYIQVLNNSKISNLNELSISCWVNINSVPSFLAGIVTKWQGTLNCNSFTDHYSLWISNDTMIVAGSNNYQFFPNKTLNSAIGTKKWYHIVFVNSATNGGLLYINGKLAISNKTNSSACNSTNPLYFGCDQINGNRNRYYNGKIDDIGLWNRSLNECEISSLYKASIIVPTVSIGKDTQSFCGVDSAKLTATTGFAIYDWSNGKKGTSVYANTTGPLSVTATDSFGCNAIDNALISIQNPRILPRDTIVCSGQAVTLRVKDTIVGVSGCAVLPTALKTGLVGWWPFCGNANDESGNGNDGLVKGAKLAVDRFGNPNNAYLFNGISDFIQVKDAPKLDLTNSYTLSGWYNTNASNKINQAFIGKARPGGNSGYHLMVNTISQVGDTVIQFGNNNGLGLNLGVFVKKTTINTSGWHFMVGTYDGKEAKLYLDGVLVKTETAVYTLQNSIEPLFFGKESNLLGRFFSGIIDEIGIWNRPLSSTEVTTLFKISTVKPSVVFNWSNGGDKSLTRIQNTGITKVWLKQFNGIGTCYDTTMVYISNPVLNVSADTLLFTNCKRDSLRISIGEKWKSAQWSHGPKDSVVFLKTTGKYSVTVKDSLGCFTADTFNFINPGRVQASISRTDSVKCYNGSTGSAAGATTGGFAPLQYKWSNGQASTTATGLQQGNYAFIATDAYGCADTAIATVKQPTPTVPSISKIDSITCHNFSNGRIVASGLGGTAPYQFRWQGGQTGNILSNLPSGVYRVYLTDKNGCKDSLNITLSNPPEVIARIVSGNMTMKGQNMDVAAQVTPAGIYTYQWQPASVFDSNANDQNATIQLSNNIKILLTATNAKGCAGKDSFEIGVVQPIKDIIPNAFSPNKDDLNEGFGLPNIFEIESFYVYDRWGGIIFEGNSSNSRWNGYAGSEPVPAGTYSYQITAKLKGGIQTITHTGKVTVVK
jgi:gliding motility-associated-like protein